jgi:hypothetical protein
MNPPEALKEAKLRTWRSTEDEKEEMNLVPGIKIILPNVCYEMSDDVDLLYMYCELLSPSGAQRPEGTGE